ncbi:MAG: type II toxin-antitoxin system HicB family antitoxin [Candidatus Accumulibacter sp.]|jgi:antitoxin HicB|nr:type II toxin-antitoxin system HicB family antitoxin [Accumulibacter sp.]
MEIRYPALVEPQPEGGFFVQFVDLPDTFTEGGTMEQALFHAVEVLSAMLDVKMDDGADIPPPSQDVSGAVYIAPDAKTQAALLVRQARGEMSLATLARAMETSWPATQRLENPNHWPSLKSLDRAASALGKRLVLVLE